MPYLAIFIFYTYTGCSQLDLATYLIRRCTRHAVLANYFCWYLYVECDDKTSPRYDESAYLMYIAVLKRFSIRLKTVRRSVSQRRDRVEN